MFPSPAPLVPFILHKDGPWESSGDGLGKLTSLGASKITVFLQQVRSGQELQGSALASA